MKRIVLEEPLTWAIVCLVSSTVAEQVGPDVLGVYLTALGVAAISLAFILFPGLRSGDAGMRRPSRLRALLGAGRSKGSR